MGLSLDSKDIALTGCFGALYAVLSTVPLFPVIGIGGRSFTLALLVAPLVGIIIGPYLGALAASIGGLIGWSIAPQYGVLLSFSFVPGAATALCSGYLYNGKWKTFVIIYSALLLALGFYPLIGPLWLYPLYIWFHVLGLIILVSLAKLKTINSMSKHGLMLESGLRVGVISFIATLFGHIVGGLIFNTMYFHSNVDYWRNLWQILVFVYPIERSIVVFISILIGAPLIKALRAHGFQIGGK